MTDGGMLIQSGLERGVSAQIMRPLTPGKKNLPVGAVARVVGAKLAMGTRPA